MARDWNEHYAAGEIPWDRADPDPQLVELVQGGRLPQPGRALDVGCGTGTHARYLAEQGYAVTGLDLSPLAIEQANARTAEAQAQGWDPQRGSVTFHTHDVLATPIEGRFDLVFDRGCFHTFDDPADRARFAERVAAALAPDGCWVSFIGSTEGPPRDYGPPRRSARDVAAAVEPVLALAELRTSAFDADGEDPRCAWILVARPRAVPAQPSTGSD